MRRFLPVVALVLCTASSAGRQPMLVLAVSTYSDRMTDGSRKKTTYVEPIAFAVPSPHGVAFQQWPNTKEKSGREGVASREEFVKGYYRPGTKYRVFRGGVADGIVTIGAVNQYGCEPIQRGGLETSDAQLTAGWRGSSAIAVGSFEPRRHSQPRRPPSAEEQEKLRDLARSAFLLKAVAPDAFANWKELNTVAADLDGDGHPDLVGSFEVSDSEWRHQLFLVAVWDAAGRYRADIIWYNRHPEKRDSIDASRWWSLVDYEDFDNDGIDELIVQQHGWEWSSYKILKRVYEGTWDVVYESDSFGC